MSEPVKRGIRELFIDPDAQKVSWGRAMATLLILIVAAGELYAVIRSGTFIQVPESLVTIIGILAAYNVTPKIARAVNGKAKQDHKNEN